MPHSSYMLHNILVIEYFIQVPHGDLLMVVKKKKKKKDETTINLVAWDLHI